MPTDSLDSFRQVRFTQSSAIRVLQRRAYDLRDEEYLRLNILACMLRESDVTNKSSRQQNQPVSAISRARETPCFRPRTACKCTTSCGDHSVQLSQDAPAIHGPKRKTHRVLLGMCRSAALKDHCGQQCLLYSRKKKTSGEPSTAGGRVLWSTKPAPLLVLSRFRSPKTPQFTHTTT